MQEEQLDSTKYLGEYHKHEKSRVRREKAQAGLDGFVAWGFFAVAICAIIYSLNLLITH